MLYNIIWMNLGITIFKAMKQILCDSMNRFVNLVHYIILNFYFYIKHKGALSINYTINYINCYTIIYY